jgi:hypothetical protein
MFPLSVSFYAVPALIESAVRAASVGVASLYRHQEFSR